MVQGKWIATWKESTLDPFLPTIYKNWLKMDQNLNVKPKMLWLLDENISVKLCDFGLGNGSLHITPRAQATKENKLDFIKINNFCVSKNTTSKWKTTYRMEEYICNHITDKGIVSRRYKVLLQLNKDNPIKNEQGFELTILQR